MASPFCFRPSPELAERIEEDARVKGLKRSEWLSWAVEQALSGGDEGASAPVVASSRVEAAPAGPPADGVARADAFRAAAARRLGR